MSDLLLLQTHSSSHHTKVQFCTMAAESQRKSKDRSMREAWTDEHRFHSRGHHEAYEVYLCSDSDTDSDVRQRLPNGTVENGRYISSAPALGLTERRQKDNTGTARRPIGQQMRYVPSSEADVDTPKRDLPPRQRLLPAHLQDYEVPNRK